MDRTRAGIVDCVDDGHILSRNETHPRLDPGGRQMVEGATARVIDWACSRSTGRSSRDGGRPWASPWPWHD